MKLCRFTQAGRTRIGKVIGDQVVDLSAVPGPAGVIIASNRFLKAGDVVRVEIEHLGYIENRVRPEP